MKRRTLFFFTGLGFLGVAGLAVADQPLMLPIKRLGMETALAAAKAALLACRKEGVQVAVTVVDRGGRTQVVLRDSLAMDLTLDISRKKAYTAMSFGAATSTLKMSESGLSGQGDVLFSAGGVPIRAAGPIVGGIGVSGAPSGAVDERCARIGYEAISDDLEMAD